MNPVSPVPYGAPTPPPRRSTGLVAGLVVASVAAVVLLVSTVAFAVLWSTSRSDGAHARSELSALKQSQADEQRALDIAAKYAVGAATSDYRDLATWQKAVVTGTSPDLTARLENATAPVADLMKSMQMVSKASDPAAAVSEHRGAAYKVRVYMTVSNTTAQRPTAQVSATRYDVTVDPAKNWWITDVGGGVGTR